MEHAEYQKYQLIPRKRTVYALRFSPDCVSDALQAGIVHWSDEIDSIFRVATTAGSERIRFGDWIVTNLMGERAVFSPDTFEQYYEPVEKETTALENDTPEAAPSPSPGYERLAAAVERLGDEMAKLRDEAMQARRPKYLQVSGGFTLPTFGAERGPGAGDPNNTGNPPPEPPFRVTGATTQTASSDEARRQEIRNLFFSGI